MADDDEEDDEEEDTDEKSIGIKHAPLKTEEPQALKKQKSDT